MSLAQEPRWHGDEYDKCGSERHKKVTYIYHVDHVIPRQSRAGGGRVQTQYLMYIPASESGKRDHVNTHYLMYIPASESGKRDRVKTHHRSPTRQPSLTGPM